MPPLISMKVNGKTTKEMEKARCTGSLLMRNIKANGKIISNVALAHISGQKVAATTNSCVIAMSAIGRKAFATDKEPSTTQTALNMKEIGLKISNMAKVCSPLKTELITQGPLRMTG